MRIEITIDTDGARTTVEHEFGLELEPVVQQNTDEGFVARGETPNIEVVAVGIARRAAHIHRLTL
jgi:hypothetical protein